MADKELSKDEVDAFKKELADLKTDMMRKELEDIKKERMRKELEELKAERASPPAAPSRAVFAPASPALSPVNLALAALMLLAAGYLIGTVFGMDIAGTVNGYLGGYGLPVGGDIIVAFLAVLLAALGVAIMTLVRK